jgi:hypothetical protein
MLARPLIRERVELEVDLVEAACEPDREEAAVVAPLEPRLEAVRKAEIEKAGWAGVEPVTGKAEVQGNSSDRLEQCLWQRIGAKQMPAPQRQDVDVSSGSVHKTEPQQSGSADDDELEPIAARREALAESGEDVVRP